MNRLKTTLLLALPTVLIVLMGSAIGGKSGIVFAFFMAAAMNFFSYWFSDKIVLKIDDVREALPATAHMFIVNPITGGSLMSHFSTHPPMEERIARLEGMARGGW